MFCILIHILACTIRKNKIRWRYERVILKTNLRWIKWEIDQDSLNIPMIYFI